MSKPFSWHPDQNSDGNPFDEQAAGNEEMLQAAARYRREKARLFHDVFGEGRGPELLDLLASETVELDLFSVSRVVGNETREMGVNPSEWAYHRNGQNSIVRYIIEQIRIAREVETEGSDNV